MRVKMIKDNDKEKVVCPKDNKEYINPYCRKQCNLFKGYKTVKGQRNVLCKYQR